MSTQGGERKSWGVTVFVEGESILTIEQGDFGGSLAGIPDIEKHADIVRQASEHLAAFIGPVDPPPCFFCGDTEAGCPVCSSPPTGEG